MSEHIKWENENILKENVQVSRQIYDFIERDFATCLEYIALDKQHYSVFSTRLANMILRIGPEILRIFNLILFNKRIERYFHIQPNLEKQILSIQKRKKKHRDTFMSYLTAFPELSKERVQIFPQEWIYPFETMKMNRPNRKKPVNSVKWWEYGYNALRHRIIREFNKSATLEHALYSLAGLWVLHSRLDKDWGRIKLHESLVFLPRIGH